MKRLYHLAKLLCRLRVESDVTKLPEPASGPQCWTVYSREDLHTYESVDRNMLYADGATKLANVEGPNGLICQ